MGDAVTGSTLDGKVVLVTGAGAGIGRASAVAMARRGAAGVVLLDVDATATRATAALVEDAGSVAHTVATDVSDVSSLTDAFAEAAARFGRLDVVHNNAGLVTGAPGWPATSVETIARVVGVNVVGMLAGTRLAVDALSSRGGAVVNTASIAGLAPMPDDPVYAATKAAVILFTQSCIGLHQSHGIRVNAVLPGMVDTAMIDKTGDGGPADWLAPVFGMVELLSPERVADEVVRLVEDPTAVGEAAIVANDLREPAP